MDNFQIGSIYRLPELHIRNSYNVDEYKDRLFMYIRKYRHTVGYTRKARYQIVMCRVDDGRIMPFHSSYARWFEEVKT